jgi:hypothetical protein
MFYQFDSESINSILPAFDCADLCPKSPFVKVPTKFLGAILDAAGHISAAAAHLLAIKCSKGSGYVLNEQQVAKPFDEGGYEIGWRRFSAGIGLLKKVGVLKRSQTGRKSWAKEQIAESGGGFVPFPEHLLQRKSLLVAFLLTVNLSPRPLRPAAVARRVGLTSPMTIRALVKEAIAIGEIVHETGHRGAIWVARNGHKFDLAKIGAAKNGATHSKKEDLTEEVRNTK